MRTLVIIAIAATMVAVLIAPALAAGNQIAWKKTFGGAPDFTHVETDRNNNVIVAGSSPVAQIRKYSGGGKELWKRTVRIGVRVFVVNDMAVDRAGNIYVTGDYVVSDRSGRRDSFIAKYGPRGGHHWTHSSRAFIYGLAVGPGGAVYIVGHYAGSEAFIKKYSSEGRFLWSRKTAFIWMADVAVGSGGGVYVSAYDASVFLDENGEFDTASFEDSPYFSSSPMVLRKYSPRGGVYWTRRVEVNKNTYAPHRIAVDRAGGVILAPRGAGGADSLITKYSRAGHRLWTRRWVSYTINDIAVDRDMSIYVVGENADGKGFARKYLPGGQRVWSRNFINGAASGVAADSEKNVYVTGEKSGEDPVPFITKFKRPTGLCGNTLSSQCL